MQIDITRIFQKDKLIDQTLGLAFGIGISVAVVIIAAIFGATDHDLMSGGFWYALKGTIIVTAIRSAATAVATTFGLSIPGIASGK